VVPLCQLAVDEPDLVHALLDRHLTYLSPGDLDGIVLIAERYEERLATLEGIEHTVLVSMGGRVAAASTALSTLQQKRVMERLVQRGVLQLAAFTPTDASHVLGIQNTFDVSAAHKAAELFARNRDRMGRAIAASATAVAEITVDTLVRRSAEAVLAAAFADDGLPGETVAQPVVQAVLDRRLEVVRMSLGLSSPLVGLGASASAYYPQVAALLGAEVCIPEHAAVANAVGAVVGRVRLSMECVISSPQHGQFLVHAGAAPAMFVDVAAARAFAAEHLAGMLAQEMVVAGAPVFETRQEWQEQTVEVGGLDLFVEGRLVLIASGRPELAR
jgi:N-methylhydantoinase A/oxoprolinase/acetone carboxylase beta subunit